MSIKKSLLLLCACSAFFVGFLIDYSFGNKLDYWIHDSATVYQHRTEWKHTGIVVLDDNVPYSVGRKQALPLFARATERLIEAGAKGVFLDARVSKELEGRMPYAICIEDNGSVQWSMPTCSTAKDNQCLVNNSELGNSPLKMDKDAIGSFSIAPYLNDENNLPDFLLYDWEAAQAIPEEGLVVSDRLVTYDSPVARWLDLSDDHAVYKLIEYSQKERVAGLFQQKLTDQLCGKRYPCRRIRLSIPKYEVDEEPGGLILPVSQLASCNKETALRLAALMKDKVVVLQTTAPNEATDLVVTAMTTAIFSPKLMTPGAQYLVDAVETVINQDSPQSPNELIKLALFIVMAIVSIVAGVFLRPMLICSLGLLIFIGLTLLCFLNPIIQLWPVMASILIYFTGAGQIVTAHLIVGFKEGRLIRQYLPQQIHEILMTLKEDESFKSKRCHVVVLMSDLAGYTTVTGLLKEPKLVLELMNDYLEETSFILQKKYKGILEAYVGDMVCYYWSEDDVKDPILMYKKALLGAMELRSLQKQFFLNLQKRYHGKIDIESLKKINNIIDAGIGITVGDVVMGDLGPRHGIKKFGILGDPLNLAARIEGLTRLFSTDIIIAGNYLDAVEQSGLVVRRLGSIRVKGRVLPETLYALGKADDNKCEAENIRSWQEWLKEIEKGIDSQLFCPECYQKDKETILDWLKNGLLDDGVWSLDKK